MTKEELKTARSKLGLTQEALGEKLGLSMRQVRNLEAGRYAVRKSIGAAINLLLLSQEHDKSGQFIRRITFDVTDSAGRERIVYWSLDCRQLTVRRPTFEGDTSDPIIRKQSLTLDECFRLQCLSEQLSAIVKIDMR